MSTDPRIARIAHRLDEWLANLDVVAGASETGDELDRVVDRLDRLHDALDQRIKAWRATAARTDEIREVLIGLAWRDYSQRATVQDDDGPFDAIATAVNVLSEELQAASEEVRQRNADLQDKTRILEAILANLINGVVVVDTAGRFIVFNTAARRILGVSPLEAPTEQWPALFHLYHEDRQTLYAPEELPLVRAMKGETVMDMVTFVRNPSIPSGVLVSVNARPLLAADGASYGALAVLRDITESRRAEGAIRRLAAIVESSEDAIMSFGLDGRITSWNRAAERMFGYAASEALDMSLQVITPPEQTEERAGILKDLFAGTSFSNFETEQLRQDGTRVLVSLSSAPLLDPSGRVVGASAILRDITAQKTLESDLKRALDAAHAATRAKSEFLANVSHEIRTPLTAVLGFADLLLDPRLTESERLNHVMTVRRNGEHLLLLLNDVLDFSKIEAGKLSVERIQCEPNQILNEVASLMRPRALDRNLSFDLRYATPIPMVIASDPTRLRQILMNLVSNAIKFTERGGVEIIVRCDDAGSATPRLVIDVTDTGIGMTHAQVERLFQPFIQADASMTRKYGGTGLGLGISAPLARALGGVITVRSEIARGSTFTLTLPLAPLEGTAMVANPLESGIDANRPESDALESHQVTGTILMAEDGPDNQVLIASILRRRGFEVEIADNGRIAAERALAARDAGEPYALILMDMQMPEMDGYTATAYLRARDYRGPIVALTAHAMAGERARCLAAGCDEYLTKPVQRSVLLSAVAAYVRPRHSARPPSVDLVAPSAVTNARELSDKPVEKTVDKTAGEGPLRSEFANDPAMRAILDDFVRDLPGQTRAMRAAAQDADFITLRRLAHQLNGAAGGYGFGMITDAAAALEDAVRRNEPPAVIEQFVEALARLCARATSEREGD